jgi:hypothetical protein
MGQNRRYGSDQTDVSLAESLVRAKPISLGERQVGNEITQAKEPIEVVAWVTFREATVRLPATAVAWTDRAVRVEFTMKDGSNLSAWVWASAVERLRR